MSDIAESFAERRGFEVGLQVGEGELDLTVDVKFSLCLSTGPYCQVTIQLSHPLLMFSLGPAGFLQVAVLTCPVALLMHDLLSCL